MIKGTFGTARVNRDLATCKRVRHDEQMNVTPDGGERFAPER
jgi:hypothetical protein